MTHAPDAVDTSWVCGRDAALPGWVGTPREERPRYDSVVVRGNGIGAMTIAGRLARSRSLAGKVVVAAPRPVENRRLVNGCTLRSRSIDYYAAAFATSRRRVLETIYGPRWRDCEVEQQYGSLAHREPDGRYVLENPQPWMRSSERGGRPIAYGTRNGRLVGALATLLEPLPHRWVEELPKTLDACRALAPGKSPLVIDANHQPLEDAPARPKPARFVCAAQMMFTAPRRRELGLVCDHASNVVAVPHDRALDVSVYYPMVDPLSPQAEFYGIFYRIVTPGPGFDKAAEIERLRERVVGVGRSFGLEPHDPDETYGTAMVPCSPWRNPAGARAGVLDFEAIYGAGAPIITGCGMSRAALAGYVVAESILAGEDPAASLATSLRTWRRMNHVFAAGMTTFAWPVEQCLRYVPQRFLWAIQDYPDTWAGVPGEPAIGAS